MSKSLVIVESPTKARTIEKFLGKDYEVKASYGHVRDLPNNASEIPASVKKEKWSRLGINVENNYEPLYIIPEEKKKRIQELEKALKNASEVLLATDEDREGESISWHLLEVLHPKVPVKRLVFHEITKSAIAHALASTREIDENLVKAQETRRIIDRLFGYSVSPLLWKKMAPRLSAGRVQSVALRLLVQRERERISFRMASYWDLKAKFQKKNTSDSFEAELAAVNGKRIAIGKDFEPTTGKLDGKSDVVHLDEAKANALRVEVEKADPVVQSVEEKPFTGRPYPPFTTSTLQQEGSRKLSFAAKRTMQVAQTLYENGFITYMRTDSTNLSDEAITGARDLIQREFGKEYLPDAPRIYKTKVKNAQEAHEAIRPAGSDFAHPSMVKEKLGIEAFRLYEIIWKRMLACQMKDSVGTRVTAQIECGPAMFRATGRTILFPGFLRAYVEGADDPEAELADREKILPPLKQNEELATQAVEALGHETQPPARYTEGSLIKQLELLGIGRPSTWATIVDVVLSRTYAFKKGTALVPTFLAMAVINLMEKYFTNIVDYEYTASLEEDLDKISRGEAEHISYLDSFFKGDHPGLQRLVEKGEEVIDPRVVCGIAIGLPPEGKLPIEVRIGRFGPFLTDGTTRSSLPDELAPEDLNFEKAELILIEAAKGPASLGAHPETGKPIYLKKGRFGPYVQEGDMVEGEEEKPKMASLVPGILPQDVTWEIAVKLLSLPRNLGKHPESGEDIIAANGRFGPYIKCGSDTRSLSADQSPIDVTLEQALDLLKQPKARGRAASQPKSLKEVGKHPRSEKMMVLKAGRYGPYVTDGEVNASLPNGVDPETLTVEAAANLIDERVLKIEANGGVKKKRSTTKAKSAGTKEKKTKEPKEKKAATTKAKRTTKKA